MSSAALLQALSWPLLLLSFVSLEVSFVLACILLGDKSLDPGDMGLPRPVGDSDDSEELEVDR